MKITKTNRLLLASGILLAIILLGLLFFISFRKTPERSPGPIEPKKEGEWHIQFTAKNQKTSAYTDEVGSLLPASGQEYFIGGIAVHPRYPVNAGGDPLEPILPFGTVIYPEKPITIQGQEFSTLKVIDTGDINYRLWPDSPYWFDVYYGKGSYYNTKGANKYGVTLVNYTWYEKWR